MIPFSPSYELYRRPRLLNPLHALGLFKAHTQTNQQELACLKRYAQGHKIALEIGTYMGVSATTIAHALDPNGKLYCVDPWESRNGKENPSQTICNRELKRNGLLNRIVFLQGFSNEMEKLMPPEFDFIFIDGDHSYEGLKTDWEIVLRRLSLGGIVCLHDTSIPEAEPHRKFGSVNYFNEVICSDRRFDNMECYYSLNVMRKVA